MKRTRRGSGDDDRKKKGRVEGDAAGEYSGLLELLRIETSDAIVAELNLTDLASLDRTSKEVSALVRARSHQMPSVALLSLGHALGGNPHEALGRRETPAHAFENLRLSLRAKKYLGFEWQTTWRVVEVLGNKKDWATRYFSKQIIYQGGLVYIECDGEDVEFVTRPLANAREICWAFLEIEQICSLIGQRKTFRNHTVFDSSEDVGWVSCKLSAQATLAGQLQLTEGLLIEEIPFYIRDHDDDGWGTVCERLKMGIIPKAPSRYGFLCAVLYFLVCAQVYEPSRGGDGPKEAFPLLCRTDFRSMFNSLGPSDQLWFSTIVKAAKTDFYGYEVTEQVFPAFEGASPEDGQQPTCTVKEWLDSICVGGPGRDRCSPPPTSLLYEEIEAHNHPDGGPWLTPFDQDWWMPYSMGVLGMVGGCALYENRAAGGGGLGGKPSLDKTMARMVTLCDEAAARDATFVGLGRLILGAAARKVKLTACTSLDAQLARYGLDGARKVACTTFLSALETGLGACLRKPMDGTLSAALCGAKDALARYCKEHKHKWDDLVLIFSKERRTPAEIVIVLECAARLYGVRIIVFFKHDRLLGAGSMGPLVMLYLGDAGWGAFTT